MNRLLFAALLIFICAAAYSQLHTLESDCLQFNKLNDSVNHGIINRAIAAKRVGHLLERIRSESTVKSSSMWVFPLKGYNYRAVGGVRGNGYFDKNYHYLDGNKHLAHPAHDIFIKDKDQDNTDDHTGNPVDVLAVDNGVVLACFNNWQPQSTMRGGNFIWVYHPQKNTITYYAHNSKIFVKPGDVITQGSKIAEVGRTGLNAYKNRSPTHLHFSAFHIQNGLPVPYNCYKQLVAAKNL